jgi:hypothetical protein
VIEHALTDIAFPLWRFLAVFSNPPRDLQSFNIALVDNFFFLALCVVLIGRLVRVARDIAARGTKDE